MSKPISLFRKNFAKWTHILIFIIMFFSPLYLPWYVVLAIFCIFRIQDKVFGGCLLTYMEFGNFDREWTDYYLFKIDKLQIRRETWAKFFDYVIPVIWTVIAFVINKA